MTRWVMSDEYMRQLASLQHKLHGCHEQLSQLSELFKLCQISHQDAPPAGHLRLLQTLRRNQQRYEMIVGLMREAIVLIEPSTHEVAKMCIDAHVKQVQMAQGDSTFHLTQWLRLRSWQAAQTNALC